MTSCAGPDSMRRFTGRIGVAIAFAMALCAGTRAEGPGGTTPFAWPVPEGWKSETIPFPLEFAPDVHHAGVEVLRFSKGFGDTNAPDNWTYAFAWILDDNAAITEASLSQELTAYFKGLATAVGGTKFEFDPKHFAARFRERPAASGSKVREYTGTVETYDCFHTGKPITLHMLVRTHPCEGGRRQAVLFASSRLENDDTIWPGLRDLLGSFRCGR